MSAKSLQPTFARSLRPTLCARCACFCTLAASTFALLVFALLCSVAAQSAHAQDDDDPDAVAQAKGALPRRSRRALQSRPLRRRDSRAGRRLPTSSRSCRRVLPPTSAPPIARWATSICRCTSIKSSSTRRRATPKDRPGGRAHHRRAQDAEERGRERQRAAAFAQGRRQRRQRSRVVAAVSGTTPSSTLRHLQTPDRRACLVAGHEGREGLLGSTIAARIQEADYSPRS